MSKKKEIANKMLADKNATRPNYTVGESIFTDIFDRMLEPNYEHREIGIYVSESWDDLRYCWFVTVDIHNGGMHSYSHWNVCNKEEILNPKKY